MSWSNREQHRAIRTRKPAEARIPEKPILDGADQPDLVDERPERTLWAWAVGTRVGVGFALPRPRQFSVDRSRGAGVGIADRRHTGFGDRGAGMRPGRPLARG